MTSLPNSVIGIGMTTLLAACGSASQQGGDPPPPAPSAEGRATLDTATSNLVPPGYGALRQDEIAIRFTFPAMQVRVLPLDESVIRLLAPDSYRALRDLQEGQRDAIATMAQRHNLRQPSLWYVSYFGIEPEARFSPLEVVITGGGRDFRPLELIPLTAGFGEQRLRQRETHSAIFVFDGAIDVSQPLTLTVEGEQNNSWGSTLRNIERERSRARSRAAAEGKP
ncbi:MAG: hypothetical protein M3466_00795 [Gemmatimonadota bacterium]|nr:hypothetical protein [Gemmatimonadota bacterium]